MNVYLDNAATTPLDPEVLEAMMPYLKDEYGNASAVYPLGVRAAEAIEHAREQVAELINAEPDEIFFTSGGTESDNAVLIGRHNKPYNPCVVTSKIEHPAILETCMYGMYDEFVILPVNKDGFVDLIDVQDVLLEPEISVSMVSIMYANNEIGTIQPIREIGELCRENNVLFHTDAVQAFGHIDIDVKRDFIDALSCSAHKFNGPKGVGALYIRKEVQNNFVPFIRGGHQERDMRAGTENVAGIVGIGKAAEICRLCMNDEKKRLTALRDKYIERILQIPGASLNGSVVNRLPNNINVRFSGVNGDALQLLLGESGVSVSVGSACHSHTPTPSHVLKAIGLSDEAARECIRISLGKQTTEEEMEYTVSLIENLVPVLRGLN